MLVYGDAQRVEDPREKIAAIRAGLERLVAARPRIERHAILAGLLIEAGELEQGLLDDQLARNGEERQSSSLSAYQRRKGSVLRSSRPSSPSSASAGTLVTAARVAISPPPLCG